MNRRLTDQFQLRLPDGMRERLKDAADASDRSMNAEIVARLEESFSHKLDTETAAQISELQEEIRRERLRSSLLENMNQGLIIAQQQISGEFQKVYKELRRVYPIDPGEPDDESEDQN